MPRKTTKPKEELLDTAPAAEVTGDSQTEADSTAAAAKGAKVQKSAPPSDDDKALLQTEGETGDIPVADETPPGDADAADPNSDANQEFSGSPSGEDAAPPQTDADSAELAPGDATSSGDPTEGDAPPQTKVKKPKDEVPSDPGDETKPKSRAKRAKKSESGAPEAEPSEPASSSGQSSTRRRRRKTESIIAIDEQRSVETLDDRMRNDLIDMVESMKGKKILTDTIQGVERSKDNEDVSFAVLYHGEFKVIIPASELVDAPEDLRNRSLGDVMHYMITKRLGAEVDYIVKGIDQETGIAAASRLEAMAQKRKQYYFGTDRDGNNLLYDGICAESRVVSVIRAGVFVDIFGVEAYIPLRELSYQRWIDATSHYQPGQRVLVRILEINRTDRNKIKVSASVKQAGENPYEKALRRYVIGSRYVGTVSVVDTTGVFVSLDGGIDCLCSYPKRGRPPRGSRVTVRIVGINYESNRIWGAITHMTTR